MESSTTSAAAGICFQRAECTPPGPQTSRAIPSGTSQIRVRVVTVVFLGSGRHESFYDSWASLSALSSMLISLSSLDSKTSRHSRHSTNSASSSRLTICTRGCLQDCLPTFWGCENGFEVIDPETTPHRIRGGTDSREFHGIL